ncbi:MAG: selenide, water dikinase SelD [Chloroflexi bacterium]|nr:selenide, water dikinase SelD [Chloroflexota bacterium]
MGEIFDERLYGELVVGLSIADDAAVWRVDEERALIFTADFFTPVVDDPYDYGAIAAANALSDVYAMGGRPFLALNLAALPGDLPEEVITGILRGSAEKVREAGAIIAGGHTIDDEEPKFGLAVLGWVHPQRVATKAGARPGDLLILTKPLGSGIITTAYKADLAAPEHIAEATRWMKQLNKDAAFALADGPLHAVTDITGFGLLGHGYEVAERSRVGLRIHFDALPFQPGVKAYANDLLFPAMANNNMADYGVHVTFAERLEYEMQLLTFCPETSGGLFISLPPEDADAFARRYRELGHESWVIGEVTEGPAHIWVE